MERPTITIKTPSDKDLVVKTYLTARERNAVREISLEAMKVKMDTQGKVISNDMEMSGTLLSKLNDALIKQSVVSYAGQTNGDAILNNLLDGLPEEYDFVVAEASKLQTGTLTQVK